MTGNTTLPLENSVVEIDLDAICANWTRLSSLAPASEVAAVVKADAYGLGAGQVVPALAHRGVTSFFVATLREGIQVRQSLSSHPGARVFVLNSLFSPSADLFVEHQLTPVLNSLSDIIACAKDGRFKGPLGAAIHLDTGMNRLGLPASESDTLARNGEMLSRINVVLWMSHLACADEPDNPHNERQLQDFQGALARLPKAPVSLANSAGVFLGADYHFDLVRPGIALYGGNPGANPEQVMHPCVKLMGTVLQVRTMEAGETVGYGADFVASGPTRVATIGAGYADGILRCMGGTAAIEVDGHTVPVIGRVSMDLIALDVSDLPNTLKEGDQIPLIDDRNTLDTIAAQADTISYEILTRLGPRSTRIYRPAKGETSTA